MCRGFWRRRKVGILIESLRSDSEPSSQRRGKLFQVVEKSRTFGSNRLVRCIHPMFENGCLGCVAECLNVCRGEPEPLLYQ